MSTGYIVLILILIVIMTFVISRKCTSRDPNAGVSSDHSENSSSEDESQNYTDTESEGLYIRPTGRPAAVAVQKPLIDLSITPMKREIPPMLLGRTAVHRSR